MPAKKPKELHTLFVTAFNAGDIEQLLALYEKDAKLSLEDGAIIEGIAAIREVLKGFLALKGKMVLQTHFATEAGDIALLSGGWTLATTGPDFQPIEMNGITAEVARRQADGTWKYLIDYPYGTKTTEATVKA